MRLARLGAKVNYRCANSSCILATSPADSIEQLGSEPAIRSVELLVNDVTPSATAGVANAQTQTVQFWAAGIAGHGINGDELPVATFEAPEYANRRDVSVQGVC